MNAVPKTNEEYDMAIANRMAELKDNAVLFMPTEALTRYIPLLTIEERAAHVSNLQKLAKYHPFIGGLIFETDTSLAKDYGVSSTTIDLVKNFMAKNGFDLGEMPIYNNRTDLVQIMDTPLPNNYGTARRDKYREHLNKILGHKEEPYQALEIANDAKVDGCNRLVVTFNMNAQMMQDIQESNLTNDDVAKAIHGSLKRVVRRAFLKVNKINIPTEIAQDVYDSNEKSTISISMEDGVIKATIPLTNTVNGNFKDGNLTSQDVEEGLSREIVYGVRLACAVKHLQA